MQIHPQSEEGPAPAFGLQLQCLGGLQGNTCPGQGHTARGLLPGSPHLLSTEPRREPAATAGGVS